jgi:hypothetical protein
MSWLISAKQYIPAVIGEPFGGGYFAGYISHTADGNPTHALIVAPRATGATGTGYTLTNMLQWKTAATSTSGTASTFDGVANTTAMVVAGIADHPAAQFCVGLNIAGHTDWYLPSRYELDIAYFNLKSNTTSNDSLFGENPYSVPKRPGNYSAAYPAQTTLALFSGAGSEAFVADRHWTSTERSAAGADRYEFSVGGYISASKTTNSLRVRAFRRIAL